MNQDLIQKLFLDLVTQIHAKTHDSKLVMVKKFLIQAPCHLN
jgi:hypothetical protein